MFQILRAYVSMDLSSREGHHSLYKIEQNAATALKIEQLK